MRARTGIVASFDDGRGLGTIDDEGERYAFHATALSDGSRTVAPGAEVAFVLGPVPGGSFEAVSVRKRAARNPLPVSVRGLRDDERPFMLEELGRRWGDTVILARGERIELAGLDALVAVAENGERVGMLSYRLVTESLEIVTLDAFVPRRRVGSVLLAAATALAAAEGTGRLFLITTNDNLPALGFYMRNGFQLVAVHHNAVAWSRVVKPTIPLRSGGIEVRDEVELELVV